MDTSNRLRAALAPSSDGFVLTFYDSTRKKTLTVGNNNAENASTLTFWDGNNVIAGTGRPRVSIGESNPKIGSSNGFGVSLWDNLGHSRTALYLTYDNTASGVSATAANGSTTGVFTSADNKDQGFYANDLHGKLRSFLGNSLDGTSYNYLGLNDDTGALRTGITVPSSKYGIGYFNQDADGTGRIYLQESADSLYTILSLYHKNGLEGLDGFAGDEPGAVQSTFAVYNAAATHIAAVLNVEAASGDAGFVGTYNKAGSLSGHLP